MNGRIVCGVVATLLLCNAAFAQQTPPADSKSTVAKGIGGLEDIVVNANRREQNLQDVGLSIAAFTGEELKEQGVVTAADLTTLRPPGIISDQYGWGHTGTVDGAKSCAWVTAYA